MRDLVKKTYFFVLITEAERNKINEVFYTFTADEKKHFIIQTTRMNDTKQR
jgi:hypothetical protein